MTAPPDRRAAPTPRTPRAPRRPRWAPRRSLGRLSELLVLAWGLALAFDLGDGGEARAAGSRARSPGSAPRQAAREPPAARSPPTAHHGEVRFVTEKRVYLDRGASDGLAPGQSVQLTRNGRATRRCAIDLVADHAAVCHAAGARPGDLFRVAPRRPPARPAPRVVELPPVIDDQTLQARAQAVAAAPHEKVDFTGQGSASLPASITLGAGMTVWSTPAGSTGPNTSEELDVQLRRIRVGQGDLRLDAAFSVVTWQRRSAELRFRPDSPTQLYLWEAEISQREVDDRTVFAFGRVWPWHVPGVPVLDGVQLGRRNEAGTAEAGAYGGTVPTALSLVPTADTWTGGLYGALSQSGTKGDLFRFAREEARLGLRHSPTVGVVDEGEMLAGVSCGSWAADGSARLRYAAAVEHAPALEQAYLGLRLGDSASASGAVQLRYVGVAPEQQPLLVNELPALRGGYHASLNTSFGPRPWLQFGLSGSTHVDLDSDAHETDASLDVRFPRMFGATGGLWAGVAAAEGWMRSRSAYVQFLGRDQARVQILARLIATSNAFTTPTTTSLTAPAASDLTELGGYLQLEAAISARLRLRARGLVRVPVLIQGDAPSGSDSLAIVSGVDAILAL
jgi:hypothetical protein